MHRVVWWKLLDNLLRRIRKIRWWSVVRTTQSACCLEQPPQCSDGAWRLAIEEMEEVTLDASPFGHHVSGVDSRDARVGCDGRIPVSAVAVSISKIDDPSNAIPQLEDEPLSTFCGERCPGCPQARSGAGLRRVRCSRGAGPGRCARHRRCRVAVACLSVSALAHLLPLRPSALRLRLTRHSVPSSHLSVGTAAGRADRMAHQLGSYPSLPGGTWILRNRRASWRSTLKGRLTTHHATLTPTRRSAVRRASASCSASPSRAQNALSCRRCSRCTSSCATT